MTQRDRSVTAHRDTLAVGDRERTFTVVGEPRAASGRALVLVFHGSRQTGETHRRMTGGALDRLAADGRAVVAYLDGHRGNWNDARRGSRFPARQQDVDDVGFAHAVVQRLHRTHAIDPARVVLTGFSNGGQLVLRLLHDVPELAAGAVVVATTMPVREDFLAGFSETAAVSAPVTIVAGTADPIAPYRGGRMAWWARTLFRVDGHSLSAPATAQYFAARAGVTTEPRVVPIPPARAGQRTRTTRTDYGDGDAPMVSLVTVEGGGHTVPAAKPGPAIVGATGQDLTIDTLVEEMLDRI
ncbi:alpha/beta hydrolase family esterase [Microbacterium oleivorans]|uniref:alpha/beta hydrolase family esterase n=1 Tax=Microbacterium oleivorans TaxID=273677 RepID=UPI002041B6E9|nr:PHB depolymerase family esterase [Microbacterium oleivorans]MCM3696030.1 hypothetical protein [Microbacterium oleivorans]